MEEEIIAAYEAAMQEWREQEAALEAQLAAEEGKVQNAVGWCKL